MDSYGTHYHLLSSAADFRTTSGDACLWDESVQLLRLAVNQQPRVARLPRPEALLKWQQAQPLLEDTFGQLGFLSSDRRQLLYARNWDHKTRFDQGDTGAAAGPVLASSETDTAATAEALSLDPVDAPRNTHFVDLHLGGDGRVVLPYSDEANDHGLLVVHLARRWQSGIPLPDAPKRAWVDYLNRIWLAGDNWYGLHGGEPLPQQYRPRPDRFEPLDINPDRLHQHWQQPLPPDLSLMAMCADSEHLYLLVMNSVTDRQEILVRSLDDNRHETFRHWQLPAEPLVTDIRALAPLKIALLVAQDAGVEGFPDIPVVHLPEQGEPAPEPRRYPQHSQLSVRFTGGGRPDTVRYLSAQGPKRLYPLAQARFVQEGTANLNQTLDSGNYDTVWHRVCFEACIPPGCRLQLEVKAFDDYSEEGSDWQLQPPPLWRPIQSELPFYQGSFAPKAGHEGLFEIQLQRQSGTVRQVRGRYLKLRVHMRGDGRHTPAVACMRVYYPRFSWQTNYLPELFHQQEVPGTEPGPANGADIRERLLASLEGLLTPVEESIANAECWSYPAAAPERRLPRLAASIGEHLPGHWPVARQRRWLQAEGALQQQKGTYAGLCLALDIASDGAVARGQVVPVENYRLRRTLATIIGIDLDDADHPLTLGTGQSGNSIVGESLILTDEQAQEFLALFAPELATTAEQKRAVADFFDRYAHRLSIVIHHEARPLRHTLEQVLQQQVPAHITWKILETDHPFVLGLSPLLGIDTYLERQPAWRQVVLNDTYLGREGIMRNHPALSPADLLYGD